jgi:hypothetical protein
LIGGTSVGSSYRSLAIGLKLPGNGPPTSPTWHWLKIHENSRPSQNTGANMPTSMAWMQPIHGSLVKNTSPGSIPGLALRCSSVHLIGRSPIAANHWIEGPAMTRSAVSVSSAVLKSSM